MNADEEGCTTEKVSGDEERCAVEKVSGDEEGCADEKARWAKEEKVSDNDEICILGFLNSDLETYGAQP